MTPFLHSIVKQMNAKNRNDELFDAINRHLPDLHAFECSAIAPLLDDTSMYTAWPEPHLRFLPSPATWLEAKFVYERDRTPSTLAYLVADEQEDFYGEAWVYVRNSGRTNAIYLGIMPKGFGADEALGGNLAKRLDDPDREHAGRVAESMAAHIRWMLAAINEPQIVGVKVHQPHKGQVRRLTGLGFGKFPLKAWTELVIGKPTRDMHGQEIDNHVADKRPLHFVRAFYKPSVKQHVVAHWRGNAAYGIKRSKYKVENRHAR